MHMLCTCFFNSFSGWSLKERISRRTISRSPGNVLIDENWPYFLLFLFSFSAVRSTLTKGKYLTFGFSFRISVFFPFSESLNVTVCKRYEFFSIFNCQNPRKFGQTKNDLGLRMVNALPFIYQPDRVALQASNVSAAEYQKREKL